MARMKGSPVPRVLCAVSEERVDRAVGQDDLEQEDGGAVQYGAAQNHEGVGQPVGFGGVGKCGVGGDGECAEGEGAVFQPDRA
nr:hypothetical protein [Neisseria meningitidis]